MAPAEDQNGRKKRKRIGGFEVLSRVGRGGMGTVYKARQVSMNRIVALKILPPSRAKNATYVQRFLREARSAAQLSHTNIVQAIDVGNADGYYYFAMEFVDGETVQALLEREGVLDERHALTIATAVAHALDHAHRHGIVHRDVKPGNIMIDRHGAVKLADLGLARSVEPIDTVTVDGVGVGTPHYIAPEQARGETDVDCRADIYSLGATLYHLLTGEPPFDGPTSAVVAAKHITMPLPSPKDKNPALSQGVCRLIRRMMAKKPNGRPQTPAKLLVEIEDALEGKMRLHPEGAPDGAEKHPARRRARKSHTLLWLLLAGVLAAGVGAVIALNRPGNDAAGLAAQTQQAEAAYDAAEAMRAERPDEALAAFRAIVRKYPRTEWAGRAAIRMEALERLEGPKVVEKPPTEPGPREAAPTEQGTAEDLAALEARCNAFVKKDNLGDAIAAVDAFLQKNPDGENTEAAQTLKTQTLALADARYATLVLTADSAAADGDYVKARAALTTAAALGIPGFADGAKALLPDLDALQTRAAEEAKWRDTMARAIQATEEGRCDQALEALEAARDLELDDIEARIAKQAEIIEAARTEAVDAAVTAYTPFGDEVQSLLAARQYDDADALLTEVARRPELALAADHVAADVEAVKLLRAFWLGVEVGIEAKKGTSLTFGAASGTVTDVRGGNVILSANNVEFKVNIRKLPARQALLHAKFEDRSVAARARVVLLLAERVDLDRVPAALAAAGDTPYAAVYKARLERALGATAGAEKSRRETDAQAAWRKIAAFASPKLTAPRAKQLVGMLDRFTEQFQGTKAQADVLEDSSALRARAAKVAGAWVKLFDGKSLRGWTSVIRREGSAATVRKDGALEVVGARTLLHTFGGEDVAIRARVRRTGAYNVSLYVRTDAGGDNGYYGWYDGAHFRIGKLVEGDGATLASARIRGPRKDVVDLMFAASGSSLALTADGEIVARAKDSTFGTGLAGVGVYKRTTAFFGRIEARSLDRPTRPKPPPGKWIRLFDGKSMRGWTPVGKPDPKLGNGARVRDGSLELMGSIQLVHPFAAADVELRARVRKTPGQNVGFWLRRSKAGQYAVWFDGAKFSIGKSVPDVGYTSLAVADAPKGPATAHSITAIASGSVVTVAVDGQELLRVNDPAPLGPGCVGVTTYNSGKTQVRDIDARALPTADLIEPETPEVPAEAEPEAEPEPEPEPGKWVTLFDGKSLDGWEAEGDAAFAIEEGVLVARYGRGGGRLRTARPWSNFELRFVYRRLQPGNAGLWFRDGYKYDIAARPGHRSGSLYCKDKGFLASNPDGALEKRDDWNEAQVYAKGDHLMLWLNDRQVADVHDATFAEGPICIEVSALGARSLELAILRIDIRPLRPDDPPDLLKPGGADAPKPPEEEKGGKKK